MREARRDLKSLLALTVVCLLALRPAPARALSVFGDIAINVKSEPRGQATHGYSEYVFTLTNRSTERAHAVTLAIPKEEGFSRHEDRIRSVTHTVQVEPKTTLQVSLLHPDYPAVAGDGLKVIIDGREQDGGVPLATASGRGGMARAFGYGRRGWGWAHSKGGTENRLLDLVGRRVGEKFRFEEEDSRPGERPGTGLFVWTIPADMIRSEEPVGNWSSRWLGYSRYDSIVLTRDELEGLGRGPAESQAVRTALFQYVEAGGVLLVLDAGPLTIPASWKRNQETRNGVQVFHGGFGVCLQVDRDSGKWPLDTWNEVSTASSQTAAPYQNPRGLRDANTGLPIVEDIGLPVRGLFVLMLLFTIVIGPLNLWLLARWKRRIWLLWTVPVISLVTCTAVFGYMIFAEGWQGRTRVVAFTLLDETEQRATTLGRAASYSPLTPSDGLHFSQDTEVTLQGLDGEGSSAIVCDLDWTRDQHLRRGWMSARVPAHFQLRRSEGKRLERLPVSREADGSLQVTNQLGASIRKLWVADEKGKIYTAEAVGVGQRAPLSPWSRALPATNVGDAHRQLYAVTEWASLGTMALQNPQNFLAPRTYLAVVESSPFLESGLAGAVVRPTESYVLGLMAEE